MCSQRSALADVMTGTTPVATLTDIKPGSIWGRKKQAEQAS